MSHVVDNAIHYVNLSDIETEFDGITSEPSKVRLASEELNETKSSKVHFVNLLIPHSSLSANYFHAS